MVGVPVGEHDERNRVRCQRGLVLFVVLTWVDNDRPGIAGDPVRLCAVQSHGARIILLQHPHALDRRRNSAVNNCAIGNSAVNNCTAINKCVHILLTLRHAPSMQEPPDSFRRSAVPVWGGCASKVVVVTREVSAPACWKEVGCDGNGQR